MTTRAQAYEYRVPRCQVLPEAGHQVSFQVDGEQRLRWHYGNEYPRPFFYPLSGPSGTSLTRMGHPGDFSHEHHRSVWFAHHDVAGVDFWSDRTTARVRQARWLHYEDGDDECAMAALIAWYDGHDAKLMEQELVAAIRPGDGKETFVELQSTFVPNAKSLTLGKTNFGFLAVRVAKNLSAHFGGGQITNSAGKQGEPDIFGQPASWMDYSGPVGGDKTEGITYFDHPANPGYPSRWHVRVDGWMGASLCREKPLEIRREKPLWVRYLLHIHAGPPQAERAEKTAARFAASTAFELQRVRIPHQGHRLTRMPKA